MGPRSSLALAAYLVIAIFMVFPILDTAAAVLPARVGEVSWRFGAAGIISRILPTLLLGLLLTLFVALALEHRSAHRRIGLASLVLALFLGVVLLVFLFDATRMDAQLTGPARDALRSAAGIAAFKYVLSCVGAVLIARAAMDSSA